MRWNLSRAVPTVWDSTETWDISMLQDVSFPALAVVVLAVAGCASPGAGHDHAAASAAVGGQAPTMGMMSGRMDVAMMAGRMAVASMTPTQGSTVRGLVMFHQMDGHLMVHAKLSGLAPNREHGFHVHETGSCASADGSSAGGHFNPDGQPHGPQNAAHHAGDLPALKADALGRVDQKFMLMGVSVADGPTSVVGRSVIVHAQPDDYTTQPTGNSGARLGCGVIAGH
jgi:superoxide dismutase, Cu-Zn family